MISVAKMGDRGRTNRKKHFFSLNTTGLAQVFLSARTVLYHCCDTSASLGHHHYTQPHFASNFFEFYFFSP